MTAPLIVQQLNASQWHVVDPIADTASGVLGWVEAVSYALSIATAHNREVVSVGLNGNRLLLCCAGVSS